MKSIIKKIFKLFIPQIILKGLRKKFDKKQFEDWQKNGCPDPPPHIVKQMTIRAYQKKYGHKIFVETGTYIGDMVEAQKASFGKIISIELGVDLYRKARNRFRNEENIVIIQGDSGKVLPKILVDINESVIFWLDGHYSAGKTAKGDKACPIFDELDAIFYSNKFSHIILIDDARCFNGESDFPTIDELTDYIGSKNKKYQIEIKHDIIRCTI